MTTWRIKKVAKEEAGEQEVQKDADAEEVEE
jgi:hypothetical protein